MNPQNNDNPRSWASDGLMALESGTVTRAPSNTPADDNGHGVQVTTEFRDEPFTATVRVDQVGDANIPQEGDEVLIGYQLDGTPTVLGSLYTRDDEEPYFRPGERVVGHPPTDSHIRIAQDGSVVVNGPDGSTIECHTDGTVSINDGNTAPVTDVDFANETVTRSNGVFVPDGT